MLVKKKMLARQGKCKTQAMLVTARKVQNAGKVGELRRKGKLFKHWLGREWCRRSVVEMFPKSENGCSTTSVRGPITYNKYKLE